MKSPRLPLSRRKFLAGCGALPVLAGLFDPARRAFASVPASPPTRLLVFGQLEGNIVSAWRPTGGDASFTLSDALSPLAPWKSKLLVLDHFDNQTAIKNGNGDTHGVALTGVLTGNSNPLRQENQPTHAAPSESIDQFLRDKIRGAARLPSIELTVGAACVTPSTDISYPRGGGNSIIPIGRPSVAFDTLFAGVVTGPVPPDDPAAQRLRLLRTSVLDHVSGELGGLTRRLGSADAIKVQAHLDAIRDIERQVTAPPITCSGAQRPTDLPTADKTTIPPSAKLMMDLVAQSFACDLTRVVTFAVSNSGFGAGAPWLGEPRDIHLISHNKFADADWNVIGPEVMKWNYQQLAYLLDALGRIPEGTGTVLDHTLVLSIGEFGDSGVHHYTDLPIVLIGDAGGYLRTGRLVSGGGKPHNNVLVTVANALGVATQTFGDPTLCDGGAIPSLLA